MKPEDTVPAVRRISTNRDDAYGFDLVGRIASYDIENMYGLLEATFSEHDKIDLLLRMTDCDGFDRGVFLKETTLALESRSLRHVRKCALVGGPAWIAGVASLLSPFLSMKVRHFSTGRDEAAWKWIDAEPS